MSAKVTSRDNGYADLLRRVKKLAKGSPYAEIGILAPEGAALAKGSPDGLTVLEVAEMNEFGLGVPERSFIRAFYDTYENQARDFLKARMADVFAGRLERKQALHQFGIWLVAMCQKRIRDGIDPPNSDYTKRLKGSSTPLIDTGQLWTSITFRTSDEEQRADVRAGEKTPKEKAEKKGGKSFFVSARKAVETALKQATKAGKAATKAGKAAAKAATKAGKAAAKAATKAGKAATKAGKAAAKATAKSARRAVKLSGKSRRAVVRTLKRTGKALKKAQREYRKAERIERAARKKFGRD